MAWIRACGGDSSQTSENYIIKNGISTIGDFKGYVTQASNIAEINGYYSNTMITRSVTNASDENRYIELKMNKTAGADGSWYTFGSSIGSYSSFDVTDYNKLIIECDALRSNANIVIGLTKTAPSANYNMEVYSGIAAGSSLNGFTLELDTSNLTGYYFLVLFMYIYTPFNYTSASTVRIKNAYLV